VAKSRLCHKNDKPTMKWHHGRHHGRHGHILLGLIMGASVV